MRTSEVFLNFKLIRNSAKINIACWLFIVSVAFVNMLLVYIFDKEHSHLVANIFGYLVASLISFFFFRILIEVTMTKKILNILGGLILIVILHFTKNELKITLGIAILDFVMNLAFIQIPLYLNQSKIALCEEKDGGKGFCFY